LGRAAAGAAHLCHIRRLPPRPVPFIHQHGVEGLQAAQGQRIDVHHLDPGLWRAALVVVSHYDAAVVVARVHHHLAQPVAHAGAGLVGPRRLKLQLAQAQLRGHQRIPLACRRRKALLLHQALQLSLTPGYLLLRGVHLLEPPPLLIHAAAAPAVAAAGSAPTGAQTVADA
jgi:hypothetical protein